MATEKDLRAMKLILHDIGPLTLPKWLLQKDFEFEI